MEVDEGNMLKHANVESVDDEEFFEFEEVESFYNNPAVESDETPQCRFCWSSETAEGNPLISSCKCAGSVGFIHYQCLKLWLESKKTLKSGENYTSIFWKSFECEICKKAYPLMIKSNGANLNLVDYDRPKSNYLVLESLNQEKNTSRIVHLIRPNEAKDTFKMGRGHESDLRINDISVSRLHAMVKFKDGKFLLEDNLSKFGTLVLIKKRTPLLPGYNKAV